MTISSEYEYRSEYVKCIHRACQCKKDMRTLSVLESALRNTSILDGDDIDYACIGLKELILERKYHLSQELREMDGKIAAYEEDIRIHNNEH